jgi:hypothetical protein
MSGQKSNSRDRLNMIGSERTNISLHVFVKITTTLLSDTSVASHGSIQTYIQRCHGEDSLLGIYLQVARGWQTHPSLTSDLSGRPLHNFSVASSVCSLKLPPRPSLSKSCSANLRVVLLHLGKVCLKVELGVARVGYYCASNVSMLHVI